jgi:hypothetical protein
MLPRLNSCMKNSVVSKVERTKIDELIRKIINEMVRCTKLSKNLFYTSCKYCGWILNVPEKDLGPASLII